MTFPVPEAVLKQHTVILGKTRSGKSSTMRLLVERLLDNKKPVCIIDPKGDWWGIKSSADGKRAGYEVVIFGGKHADVERAEIDAACGYVKSSRDTYLQKLDARMIVDLSIRGRAKASDLLF